MKVLRARDSVFIALALALLAAALALGGFSWRLDRVVYDLGLTLWRRPAPPDITIVEIDDASIAAIGRWPWRRAVHATLLQQLAAARPKAVALDLVLSEADADPAQDALLAQALRGVAQAAAPVVLPVAWQSGSNQPVAAVEPTPVLRAAVQLGASEAPVDADGVLRHAFLRAGPPGAPYPHLALALLQAAGETPHPGLPTLDPEDDPAYRGWTRQDGFLIRYAGPPGSLDHVSYVDVLAGRVPAARLAGRYLLVGSTALGLGDTLATPVNRYHQAMPGIEVLAHTLYTLRSSDTVRALPDGQVAALSAALAAALVASFGLLGRTGARRALPLAVASVPLAVAASLLALGQGLWVSPVPYVLPALLAYPLWSWRRLERAIAGIDHEIARLADEQLTERRASPRPADDDAIDGRLQALQDAGALLRQARRFLADALAAMPTAMLVADDRARVVLANPRAAALFEVESPQELQQLDLVRLLGEFEPLAGTPATDWQATAQALVPGGDGVAVEATMAGGGDYVVHVAAVDLQGQRRLIVTVADVEPVKRAQREREEVLAFVSHDLRSPASSIVLLADLHLQGKVQTPTDELLRELRRLAARTLEMSEGFVRAAQVQTRALAMASVPLPDLLEEALADLRPQARARQVTLAAQGEDAMVWLDRPLVARAIGNLVSNAIKHSPAGAAVQVRAWLEDSALHLQVADAGRGLTTVQLQELAQGDQGASVLDARGVGLGLVFVQRVAARHGGRLHARNGGPGAVFELVLPAGSTLDRLAAGGPA